MYQRDIETLEFPGTNGADFRLLGFHSSEFEIETKADTLTEALAWDQIQSYRNLITQPPVNMTLNSHDFEVKNSWKVKVLGVTPGGRDDVAVKRNILICGGRVNSGINNVTATATWRLKWTL